MALEEQKRWIIFIGEHSNFAANVPVKSKLRHPPGQTPGHLNFWKNIVQTPTSPGRKAVQMPHPWENYQSTVLTSVASGKLLKLWMVY